MAPAEHSKPPVVVIVDPEMPRHTGLAAALYPGRVVGSGSLHHAYSVIEEIRPTHVLFADQAAMEAGFGMVVQMLELIGAQWFVFGQTPPGSLTRSIPWVPWAGGRPDPLIEALSGRAPLRNSPQIKRGSPEMVVIGASTGGVTAIETVLSGFTAESPPTLIVQHIRPGFIDSFLARLDRSCAPRVVAAKDGTVLSRGCVYVAADAGFHLTIVGSNSPCCRLVPAPPDCPHRPSVDALFHSAAAYGPGVAAALLTGMGTDGASGLLAIRAAGGFTIAQDRATSTVYGMPRAASELGAAMAILPVSEIGTALIAAHSRPSAMATQGIRGWM